MSICSHKTFANLKQAILLALLEVFALHPFNWKIPMPPKFKLHCFAFSISSVNNFCFIAIVNTRNVCVFCKIIFMCKLDLFWTASVLLQFFLYIYILHTCILLPWSSRGCLNSSCSTQVGLGHN
jgi:hypothetical protein